MVLLDLISRSRRNLTQRNRKLMQRSRKLTQRSRKLMLRIMVPVCSSVPGHQLCLNKSHEALFVLSNVISVSLNSEYPCPWSVFVLGRVRVTETEQQLGPYLY